MARERQTARTDLEAEEMDICRNRFDVCDI